MAYIAIQTFPNTNQSYNFMGLNYSPLLYYNQKKLFYHIGSGLVVKIISFNVSSSCVCIASQLDLTMNINGSDQYSELISFIPSNDSSEIYLLVNISNSSMQSKVDIKFTIRWQQFIINSHVFLFVMEHFENQTQQPFFIE